MSEDPDPSAHGTDESRYGYGLLPLPPSTPTPVHPQHNQYFPSSSIAFSPFAPVTPGPFGYPPPHYGYAYPSPFAHMASTPVLRSPPPLTDAEKLSLLLDNLAIEFGRDLFKGIVPGSSSHVHVQKRVFKWPIDDVTTEDRILVVIRAIRKAGFPTIGSFFAALFERLYAKHTRAGNNPAHHPVAIVDLIFHHVKSQRWNAGIAEEPSFSLPRHALRPSLRMDRNLVPPGLNSTRNGLINWALNIILVRADKEANRLVDPAHGSVRLPNSEPWGWDAILSAWSILQSEETIATVAPSLFAMGTTVAVNYRSRLKLEMAVGALETDAQVEPSIEQSLSTALPFHSGALPDSESSREPEQPEDQPDAGSDSEEEEDEPAAPADSIPFATPIGRRDPWQAVTVSILVLLYFRYRFALVFPMLIGLFAFTCNANRDLVSLLCRLGLTVSYQTTLATLTVLAADSEAQLRLLGAFSMDLGPGFLLLFDNVNKMQRAWQATLGRKDEVKSGTASTVIELEDVPPGAMLSEPLLEKIKQKVRLNLTVKQMQEDIDWPHIRGIGAGSILPIWLKYIPFLSHHRAAIEALFTTKHAKHRLRLRKSKIRTARPTNIDESTTVGVANVLRNLIIGQLFILPISLFKWMIMICGDQLSIDRIRKIIRYTAKADPPYEQHKWALPVIQLWHLKWAWQKAIFRLHWYPDLEKGTFGLHHDCVAMEHEKFNHEKCDFYPAHHILEDRFECMVLDALRLLCEQKTDLVTPSNTKLLDALPMYFAPDGPLSDCTFEQLHGLASIVYDRYMCSAAADDALGHLERDINIYATAPRLKKKQKRARTTAGAQPALNFSGGDQAMVSLCHFMHVTLWYMELCAATAEGDIGRVFEVLKLLRFSFWGTGSTNYGNELLELACNFLYEYSDDLKIAVLNNYLVNPSGRAGFWLALDLLHYNFWIKVLFNTKSHDFDSKHLADRVGLNIAGISDLREKFPGLFGLQRNGQRHTDTSTVHDINRLGVHFRKNHILEYEAGRNQPYTVKNEFGLGYSKLVNGQLKIFLERTASGGSATGTKEEPSEVPAAEFPATPVTMVEGVLDLAPFITGD
ncbi:hypothetical protein C8R43DRAFT_1142534 [Mycena crocata]|nr:hypothetical protein C8R43DRAFT_1142534 [Mycena crocata]